MSYYTNYQLSFAQTCAGIQVTAGGGESIKVPAAIDRLCGLSREVQASGGQQIFCGNGASAAFASHMALDWAKNARVDSRCFSDVALLTATVNDIGADDLFAGPLLWHGHAGDLLVTISSSGNSPNIIKALEVARQLNMQVVTFSGLQPDNKSRVAGDLNFYVPAMTYGMVECAHQLLLHAWLDCFLGIEEWQVNKA